ncbi:hypothetical protein NEOKW01_1505 [Nematocida sp. AWRm80]|nr:hypothetical protein NEOKW01_1505 [Nematocida sp. AWRm80]
MNASEKKTIETLTRLTESFSKILLDISAEEINKENLSTFKECITTLKRYFDTLVLEDIPSPSDLGLGILSNTNDIPDNK